MEQKICTFAGHADISQAEIDLIKPKLKNEIINLIKNQGVTTFYNGGKGDFDLLCANCVHMLRNDYPFIKSYLVLAYMPQEKNMFEINSHKKFDGTLYPDIEKIPPKFAIIKRNEWMVDKSDFIITYITKNFGGARKTLDYAKKQRNTKIINLGENILR